MKSYGIGVCPLCGDKFEKQSTTHKYCPACGVEMRDKLEKKCDTEAVQCQRCGATFRRNTRLPVGKRNIYCHNCRMALGLANNSARRITKYSRDDDICIRIMEYGKCTKIIEHADRKAARNLWWKGFDTQMFSAVIVVNGARLVSIREITKYLGDRTKSEVANALTVFYQKGAAW